MDIVNNEDILKIRTIAILNIIYAKRDEYLETHLMDEFDALNEVAIKIAQDFLLP